MLFLSQLLPLALYPVIIILGLLLTYWRLVSPWAEIRDSIRLLSLLFLWANGHGQQVIHPLETLGQNSIVQAEIAVVGLSTSLFQPSQQALPASLLVRVISLNGHPVVPPLLARTQSFSQKEMVCAGQHWQVTMRLRAVHSRLNPGGFDSQRWAIATQQPFLANIKQARLLTAPCSFRQEIVKKVSQQLTAFSQQAVLFALLFGDKQLMSTEMKTLFWQTGIAHLVAISGLHISLAALFGYWIARLTQFCFPRHWMSYYYPLAVSYGFALLYVWLAGANPPALRALLALTFWLFLRTRGIFCTTWQIWLWCLAALLLYQPLWMLSDSFWLSFLAVAVLIFWFQYFPLPKPWRAKRYFLLHWLHLEVGMMLLLMPIEILIFHGISATSILANLWAVPVISLCTVPLILLAVLSCFLPALAHIFWWIADKSVWIALKPLTLLPDGWLPVSQYYLAMSGICWLFLFLWRTSHWQQHTFLIFSTLYLLWNLHRPVASNDWRVTMIDVGHGLAIAIERHGHVLLYDTGDRWIGGDMASREIIPYFIWRQLTLDGIIISHSDKDHIGGLPTLLKYYPGITVRTSFYHSHYLPCKQGERWQWQQLQFRVLWPYHLSKRADNNHSCVIKVSDGHYSLLLTGDLEKKAEYLLAKQFRGKLAATVLQVPHHGSASSSSFTLLALVDGKVALSSSSRYNPWHFPANKIVDRYQALNYFWQDTARFGQITLQFSQDHWQLFNFRQNISPRWYHQWFGVVPDNR